MKEVIHASSTFAIENLYPNNLFQLNINNTILSHCYIIIETISYKCLENNLSHIGDTTKRTCCVTGYYETGALGERQLNHQTYFKTKDSLKYNK